MHILLSIVSFLHGRHITEHLIIVSSPQYFGPMALHPRAPKILFRLIHNCLLHAFLCHRMRFIAPGKQKAWAAGASPRPYLGWLMTLPQTCSRLGRGQPLSQTPAYGASIIAHAALRVDGPPQYVPRKLASVMVVFVCEAVYVWTVCYYVFVVAWRRLGVVAVDIRLSDIEDLVRASTLPGSRLHLFVVDRQDQTVLIHPFFKQSFEVSPWLILLTLS